MRVATGYHLTGPNLESQCGKFQVPRPALDRGVKVPDSRSVHRDDYRADSRRMTVSERWGVALWVVYFVVLVYLATWALKVW